MDSLQNVKSLKIFNKHFAVQGQGHGLEVKFEKDNGNMEK